MSTATASLDREMTLEEFRAWDQKELGGSKYEWKDGHLEPAGGWTRKSERAIVANLMDRFNRCSVHERGDRLFAEAETYFPVTNATRIPDLAYFTLEQIRQSNGEAEPIPAWVIEIISPSDRFFAVEDKALEYLEAGVQVVWQIFPPYKKIRILRAGEETREFKGDAICSAAPALAEFEIPASAIFAPR